MVDAEEFVKVWQQSVSVKKVAEKLGITVSSCYIKSKLIRKAGVPLKKFNQGPRGLDIPKLKQIAKQYAPKEGK